LLHLASFAVSSLPLLLAHLRWRPELVIAVAPSLLNAPAAWLIGRAARARTWLHVQDYEIDAAFGLGVLKGRRLRNAALAGEGWLMRRFDIVSSISQRMVEHGLRKGVSAMKLVELTNWVDVNAIFPLRRPSRYRATLRIPDDTVVVLYSGNMGAKQGLTILAEVAQTLAHRTDIVFVFCGDGPSKADLVEHCAGLENCRFLSLQPAAHLNELLNLADIHVLPQRANAADLVMPSKLMGMLASGRAIIATAVEGTELSNVVSPVGLIVPPEDANALASAIERLAVDAEFRHRQGISARNVATSRFSRESVMRRLDARIRACCNR
jgi:colanic acid biosynthesis glycosyl transferase WcaI